MNINSREKAAERRRTWRKLIMKKKKTTKIRKWSVKKSLSADYRKDPTKIGKEENLETEISEVKVKEWLCQNLSFNAGFKCVARQIPRKQLSLQHLFQMLISLRHVVTWRDGASLVCFNYRKSRIACCVCLPHRNLITINLAYFCFITSHYCAWKYRTRSISNPDRRIMKPSYFNDIWYISVP